MQTAEFPKTATPSRWSSEVVEHKTDLLSGDRAAECGDGTSAQLLDADKETGSFKPHRPLLFT